MRPRETIASRVKALAGWQSFAAVYGSNKKGMAVWPGRKGLRLHGFPRNGTGQQRASPTVAGQAGGLGARAGRSCGCPLGTDSRCRPPRPGAEL